MRYALLLVGAWLALLLAGCTSDGVSARLYEHPSLNIRFTAKQSFERLARPAEPDVYEVVDAGSGIHVVLWYTTTEQADRAYLLKMADMKGLNLTNEPETQSIGRHEAWVLNTDGLIGDTPIHTLLAVIQHGKVDVRPRENILYLIQIWCHESAWKEQAAPMLDILESVEIVE